jgi:hypothetical protein
MQRDGNTTNSRSLLERVGGPVRNGNAGNRFQRDDIQARIDNITNPSPEILAGGFPPMNGGMDMNAMGMAGMTNPLLLQEVMMNQMALMAQMASSMGMLGSPAAQFVGAPGFPMQGDMNMFPGAGMNGFALPQQHIDIGRGGGRGGRNGGRGRSGPPPPASASNASEIASPAPKAVLPASALSSVTSANLSPAPIAPSSTVPTVPQPPAVVVGPERPQSPTLCKFGLKCTHVNCRYSHPSPVATVESGVVLSNEPCENGRACKDKDCIKGHVSPAVLTAPGLFISQVWHYYRNADVFCVTQLPSQPRIHLFHQRLQVTCVNSDQRVHDPAVNSLIPLHERSTTLPSNVASVPAVHVLLVLSSTRRVESYLLLFTVVSQILRRW